MASQSSNSKKTTKRTSGGAKRKPAVQQEKRPIRREVWGIVLLILALCVCLSYFGVEALLLNLLATLLKGLFGYGYWLYAPVLLLSAVVLLFHGGRPVRLRVACLQVLPLLFGSLVHALFVESELNSFLKIIPLMWKSGNELHSGGVISGTLAALSIKVVSKIATVIIFLILFAALLTVCYRSTVGTLLKKYHARPRYTYEEDEEEPLPEPKKQPAIRMSAEEQPAKKTRPVIDIPLDGEKREEEKKPGLLTGFFRHKGDHVKTPDELLAVDPVAQAEEPRRQQHREEAPVTPMHHRATPIPAIPNPEPVAPPLVRPEPVQHIPAAPAAAAVSEPVKPAAEPEPVAAADNKKKIDAEIAGEEDKISREIEQKISEEETDEYKFPPITLLNENHGGNFAEAGAELRNNSRRLAETLSSFGVDATAADVIHGPTVTRYEFVLDQGVKLSKITNLADDIALALGASGVRIAPIPDKISVVGIEVPNKQVTPVLIRDVLESNDFVNHSSTVAFSVGKDISGHCVIGNIAKLPHVLIAGTTGSGKSVCTNSLIVSLIYKSSPEDVRFIMVDPKMVELAPYNGIPHLLIPVVTDPKKAAGALQWAVFEMMKRYKLFSEHNVKDLAGYNALARTSDELKHMPSLVVVIDELADLMLVAAKEVEESICRVAQMGRAAGVHLVIATQRPSTDVITGLMKANIPSRIAFAVASSLESRIILDTNGAEKLVGKGDMLYAPLGIGKPQRVQGCFIAPEEIERVVAFVKQNGETQYDDKVMQEIEKNVQEKEKGGKSGAAPSAAVDASSDDGGDELLPAAVEVVLETGQASVSMLQRRLKLGYSRAARLVDQMEERGIVGPFEGSKPRQLLITRAQWDEMQSGGSAVDHPAEPAELSEEGTE